MVLFALAFVVAALVPGSPLPPLTLADQHDASMTLGPEVRFLVFTRDMDAGDLVKDALASRPTALDAAQAVYVSDISGMPSMIATFFAVPAMRKRPYRMLLDRDGQATAALPSEPGKVTVISLRALQVESIAYADSAAAVLVALTPAAQ